MKKSRVPKEELLAFQEACRINGLPDPDFERRRTKNIVVNDAEGKPICEITPEGIIVQVKKTLESEENIVPADSEKKAPNAIVSTGNSDRTRKFNHAALNGWNSSPRPHAIAGHLTNQRIRIRRSDDGKAYSLVSEGGENEVEHEIVGRAFRKKR